MSSATEAINQAPSQKLANHKRNASSYAKVAIPLSLTKPRAKAQPAKSTAISKSKVKEVEQKSEEGTRPHEHVNGTKEAKPETVLQNGDGGDGNIKELEASTSSAAPSLGHESQTSSEDVVQPATPAPNDSTSRKPPLDPQTKSRPASIRTHLPPAFIPSSPTEPQPSNSHRHQHRLSQSFTSASGPPSAVLSPHSDIVAFQPPRRHHQQPSASYPANHTHRISDTSNIGNANNYSASPSAWQHQSASQQAPVPQYSQFNPAYRYPPRESFSSVQHPNSVMNFHPDSSSAHTPDVKHPSQDQRYAQTFTSVPADSRMVAIMPSAAPLVRQVNENLHSLSQHVATFYTSQTFSDVKLEVVFEQEGDTVIISGHRLVFARSQRLHEAMINTVDSDNGLVVRIQLAGRWVSLNAFNDAIEWLYGSVSQRLRSFDPASTADARKEQLKHVLGVIAAGQWLKVYSVSRRALELARPLLTWGNVMLALRFSLEPDASLVHGSNGATHNPGASQLLNIVLAWMTAEFPANFYPDTNAPQLAFSPRLPTDDRVKAASTEQADSPPLVTHRNSRSTNDPRLSHIRFGEIGADAQAEHIRSPSPSPSTIISSVLFSLPFELLKFFLEHVALSERLGAETVGSIIRQVVVERELRRRRALQAYKQRQQAGEIPAGYAASSFEQALVDNLSMEEVVDTDPNSASGLQLRSRRTSEL